MTTPKLCFEDSEKLWLKDIGKRKMRILFCCV